LSDAVGLILAGGSGSRLWPATLGTSKQLLPVAGRPMVYFPLATIMLAGIREIFIVASPQSVDPLRRLLGDGSHFGLQLSYSTQETPDGIAHGFGLASDVVGKRKCLALLGDNFFFGKGLGKSLEILVSEVKETTIFVKRVSDAKPFGVATLGDSAEVLSLEEKPEKPSSNLAVTGMYLFKPGDLQVPSSMSKSKRGEVEIVDMLLRINEEASLRAEELSISTFWSDLGTLDTLTLVDQYIRSIERTQSLHVLIPELIAVEQGWVTLEFMMQWLSGCPESSYRGIVLSRLLQIQEFGS
jgi:glucose-1-phosphate thymidylyltransferase